MFKLIHDQPDRILFLFSCQNWHNNSLKIPRTKKNQTKNYMKKFQMNSKIYQINWQKISQNWMIRTKKQYKEWQKWRPLKQKNVLKNCLQQDFLSLFCFVFSHMKPTTMTGFDGDFSSADSQDSFAHNLVKSLDRVEKKVCSFRFRIACLTLKSGTVATVSKSMTGYLWFRIIISRVFRLS